MQQLAVSDTRSRSLVTNVPSQLLKKLSRRSGRISDVTPCMLCGLSGSAVYVALVGVKYRSDPDRNVPAFNLSLVIAA
nr:putative integron gene cassette protein [uncultured bacterium]